ncbi:hypothetical protein Tco_1304623 [Tanacetum coccineum]
MTTLKFADTHNMVAFLSKPAESKGFKQIVDFLNAQPIRHALTVNPTIYTSCIEQFWSTVNGEVPLQALVDRKKIIITESTMRRDLQLEDAEGVDWLPNATIFEQLALMRHEQLEGRSRIQSGNIDKTHSRATPNEAGGNTLRSSGRDSISRLKELMELCTNLQTRVLDLETTKTTQANEIDSLKRTLLWLMIKMMTDMFCCDTLTCDELLKKYKRLVKRGCYREASVSSSTVSTTTTTISSQQPSQVNVQDIGKGKMVEPEKPMKKKELIRLDEEIASKLQAEFDEEVRLDKRSKLKKNKKPMDLKNKSFDSIQKMFDKAFKRVNTFFDFRTNLVEAEVDDDQEAAKIKELMEIIPGKEEVAIDAIALAVKPPSIVDWKIYKEGKKTYYQKIRADGSSNMYLVFIHMLKSFDREDLETLWKLVKAKYG